jgi:hypothetical protein
MCSIHGRSTCIVLSLDPPRRRVRGKVIHAQVPLPINCERVNFGFHQNQYDDDDDDDDDDVEKYSIQNLLETAAHAYDSS